jgi:starch phosphorylase
VELYADGAGGGALVRQEMERVNQSVDASRDSAYRAQVPGARPATDYTARLIPNYTGVAVPLEATRILWQR